MILGNGKGGFIFADSGLSAKQMHGNQEKRSA
jgi:hypothetical protein